MLAPNTPALGVGPYLEAYEARRGAMPGAALPWLAELRGTGAERFAALGFPTNRVEAWKYTSLRPLARLAFRDAAALDADTGAGPLPAGLLGDDAWRLVFVDGRLRADLSAVAGLPAGVTVAGLAETLAGRPSLLEGRLGATSIMDGQPLLALNTALMSDGAVVVVDAGVKLEKPIELLFIGSGRGGEAIVYHPRTLIVAGAGSEATVVETHVGVPGASYFANGVVEVAVERGAVLRHYKLQDESREAYHLSAAQVRLADDAHYHALTLTLGGKLTRNQVDAVVDGENVTAHFDTAYLGRERQHVDNTSRIKHAKPRSTSRQVCKGVLDDQARGVFQGQITVAEDAQKTDGHQLSRALLLSDGAEADAKPMLEIFADDVKCSHGTTVGDIDADALFYLRARGIPAPTARALLVRAFLGEVIDELPAGAIRDAFSARVDAWLAKVGETGR